MSTQKSGFGWTNTGNFQVKLYRAKSQTLPFTEDVYPLLKYTQQCLNQFPGLKYNFT